MPFSSFRKRLLGNGEDVESAEENLSKIPRRNVPAHGVPNPLQKEQLERLLNNQESSLRPQLQRKHPTAKEKTVSCSFTAM